MLDTGMSVKGFSTKNTFLEDIVRKANNNNSYKCFLLANARIKNFPIERLSVKYFSRTSRFCFPALPTKP